MQQKKSRTPYLLILPVLIVMGLLYAYPIIIMFIQAFGKTNVVLGTYTFVGLENFRHIFETGMLQGSLALTLKYTVYTCLLKIVIGFVMALFLASDIYFQKTLRFLSLVPWAVQQVTVAIIWKWVLDGNYGYLNYCLRKLHIIDKNVAFLSHPKTAFYAIAFVDAWMGISLVSMIFLSALNGIDGALYEAAQIDGAGVFKRFLFVTLPGVKKVLVSTTVLVIVWTFNSFNAIFVLTGGGPMGSMETLIVKIYQQTFGKFDIGTGSALSVMAFLILMVLFFIMKSLDREGKKHA